MVKGAIDYTIKENIITVEKGKSFKIIDQEKVRGVLHRNCFKRMLLRQMHVYGIKGNNILHFF